MISWKSYLFCENQINLVIVLDSMSPIYTFFQSAGIKENHRVDINYDKNDTNIEKNNLFHFATC